MSPLEVLHTVKISRAAELLRWSRKSQTRLTALPPDLTPRDLNEAYEIQLAVAVLGPMPHAGFKLGLTNENAQRAAGTSAPIVGRLGSLDIRRSHAKIQLPEQHLRIVEAEVIFEVGTDLPAEYAPFSEQQVRASLSRAFAGLEVCNTRFDESVEFSLPCLVADNSNADLIVVGDALTEEDSGSLSNLAVTLQRRGKPDVKGSTQSVLGNPVRAVTWLANWLASRGESLKRGQLISSGSCTGMNEVAADDSVVATFGSGAQVCVDLALESRKNEVRK
jgi:2-keto-4-pentenoate hydratase